MNSYVVPFERVGIGDIDIVGGKNASLGEMIGGLSDAALRVPGGFATTAQAYRDFLDQNALNTRIGTLLSTLDVDDVEKLTANGAQIRKWILATDLPEKLQSDVTGAWL
ncbi:uncharacterized protein METZ01_LOCUS319671, partial [marine metagenome]